MEITNNSSITKDDFKNSQLSKYAGGVPEEEKLETGGRVASLREEILSEE
ncbi:MAG: hypothetical protein ACKO3R_04555 [bacterium]